MTSKVATRIGNQDYSVGNIFEIDTLTGNPSGCFGNEGDLVVMHSGGTTPTYTWLTGDRKGQTHYKHKENLLQVYPPLPEPESETVTIVCEGKETTISRESAKELNLI